MSADPGSCTVNEAAALLRVSRVTVWRWIRSGQLPAYRTGTRVVRIKRADLAAFERPVRAGATGASPRLAVRNLRGVPEPPGGMPRSPASEPSTRNELTVALLELRASFQRTATILECMDDAFYAVNGDWRFQYVNAAAAELWGKERSSLIGQQIWEVFPEAVGTPAYEAHLTAARERRTVPFETVSSVLSTWIEGKVCPSEQGLSVYFRDISARKRAEQERERLIHELGGAEARYRGLFEHSVDPILMTDSEGCYLAANDAVMALLGYTRDELREIAPGGFSITADPVVRDRAFAQLRAAGVWRGEVELRARDGSIIPVEAHVKRLELPDGVVYLATWRDVRERRQAQLEQARLAAIVDGSVDAIIGTALDGTITTWNRSAEQLYGYTAPEIVGRSITLLIPPERAAELPSTLVERLRRGERIQLSQTVRLRKDGSRVNVAVSISPIRDATGEVVGAASIARDITEHQALQRLRSEFLQMAAHELRTPLTAVSGYAQLLERRERYDPRSVQGILTQVKRLQRLVDDLVDASRLETGVFELEPAPTDLLPLVRATVETAGAMSVQHTVRTETPPGPLVGCWDPSRLTQVLENLLSNAIKYSPGGEVLVEIVDRGSEVEVSVHDRGVGIPPEVMGLIFDRFYRVQTARTAGVAGLGLGLHITRLLVELHGGRLWAESTPGEGSVFRFVLPRTPGMSG